MVKNIFSKLCACPVNYIPKEVLILVDRALFTVPRIWKRESKGTSQIEEKESRKRMGGVHGGSGYACKYPRARITMGGKETHACVACTLPATTTTTMLLLAHAGEREQLKSC